MTSDEIKSLVAENDPLTPKGWTEEQERAWQERRERLKKRWIEIYSSSPLYRAKAAQNPEFFDRHSFGLHNLPDLD